MHRLRGIVHRVERKVVHNDGEADPPQGKQFVGNDFKFVREFCQCSDFFVGHIQQLVGGSWIFQYKVDIVVGVRHIALGGLGDMNVVFHLRSLRWRKSAITSAKGRVFPASTSARPSCSLLYSSMRPAISS